MITVMLIGFAQSGFAAGEKTVYFAKYSVPALEATYKYLDEIYLKKYPKMGYAMYYGSPSDIACIKNQAKIITKNCKTDREKAAAICKWVDNNIKYSSTSVDQFPIDVYKSRKTDCLGFAHLINDMMRSVGIPAVPVTGYIGDMKSVYCDEFLKKDPAGHAWTFAHIDGKWLLYDTLFDNIGSYDTVLNGDKKEKINTWYFVTEIEGVMPYYKNINYKYAQSASIYKNGKFYVFDENGIDNGNLCGGQVLQDMSYEYGSHSKVKKGGYVYSDNSNRESKMEYGECFRDGWIDCYDSVFSYVLPNGIDLQKKVIHKDAGKYYLGSFELTNDIDEYFLKNGYITVCNGESIPLTFINKGLYSKYSYKIRYSIGHDYTDGVATINSKGKLFVKKDGYVRIYLEALFDDGSVVNTKEFFDVYATKSANSACCKLNQHVYKTISSQSATLTTAGKTVKQCISCGKKKTVDVARIKSVTVAKNSCVYDSNGIYPQPIVKDSNGRVLRCGKDYTVKFSNNEEFGKAKVTVIFTGKYSGTKTITFQMIPGNVENFTVKSSTQTKLTLKWSPVEGVNGYRLYLYNAKSGKYEKLTDVKASQCSYTLSGLKAGQKYALAIKAFRVYNGQKIPSGQCTTLTAVTRLAKAKIKAVASKNGRVTLAFEKVQYATGYVIYVSNKKDGVYKKLGTTTDLKYSVSNLAKGQNYYFKVLAYRTYNGKNYFGYYSDIVGIKVK